MITVCDALRPGNERSLHCMIINFHYFAVLHYTQTSIVSVLRNTLSTMRLDSNKDLSVQSTVGENFILVFNILVCPKVWHIGTSMSLIQGKPCPAIHISILRIYKGLQASCWHQIKFPKVVMYHQTSHSIYGLVSSCISSLATLLTCLVCVCTLFTPRSHRATLLVPSFWTSQLS